MAQSKGAELAQLLPTKKTLTALKSDVTLGSALLELCDNSLDAWKRSNDRTGNITIKIYTEEHGDRTELIIRDNAGGVPREEASMLFGLGRTAKDTTNGAIGTFGVGAKKSLVNLGVPFSISSQHESSQRGWQYRITNSWFEDDADWTVPITDTDELQPGVTEIRISDLNYEWNESNRDDIREQLGKAYNLFLSDSFQELTGTDYDLSIEVEGEEVIPEGLPDWSYPPFDGMHPRRYENIKLEFEHLDAPVYLHITIGLLEQKDTREAGTDIYVQKRKVIDRTRGPDGGFGEGEEQLGTFNPRHERLKILVELETSADGQQLPWDTQKSSIDRHNPIMRGTPENRGVYNWLRRAGQAYYELDADKVPTAFIQPFRTDSDHAVNSGRPEVHNYENRERIVSSHRPDTDLPEVNAIRQRAEAHALLKLRCEPPFSSNELPAYQNQLSAESDRELSALATIEDTIDEEILANIHDHIGRIDELARIHMENEIQCESELAPWQQPRYQDYFRKNDEFNTRQVTDVPGDIPITTEEISREASDDEYSAHNQTVTHSNQTVSEEQTTRTAELYLVLNSDSEQEDVAKVLEVNRGTLAYELGLNNNAGEDVIWEELRGELNRKFT